MSGRAQRNCPGNPGENAIAPAASETNGGPRCARLNASESLLGSFNVPVANNGLSFLGVFFNAGEQVSRVRVFTGTAALGAGVLDDATHDVVALDDFFYSEPTPAPGSLALLGLGGVFAARRRRTT